MKMVKNIFRILWRVWFYVLISSTILLMFPFLVVLTSDEKFYSIFWKLIRAWAKILIFGMGFYIDKKILEEIDREKSYMFCANHASMLDPFILISMSKNPIVFVGKKELEKIPIFGFFYKKVVIMVDRSNPKSRKRVFEMAKKRLQNGTSMGIFPEGMVPTEEIILSPFKNGAFSLAIEFQIPIVPATYFDCKRLFSWDLFKGRPGKLRVKQHQLIETKNLNPEVVENLKQQTFDIIYKDLINDHMYMKDTNRKENERVKP